MVDLTAYSTIREATFYEKLSNSRVKCTLCERQCEITPGAKGFCKTRLNVDGKLYTLVYGDISTIESRPIEIKPFFHYWPGSSALTFSTWSCNLNCAWCQNFHLSKLEPEPDKTIAFPPEKVVEAAFYKGDVGLCASFQEPTLLSEWAISLFRIAKQRRMKYCCYVSNGYMTLQVLKALVEAGLDGLKVDVKGDQEVYEKYCGCADVEKVWRNAAEAKRLGVHVEIVNLVVDGVNDDENSSRWIVDRHLKSVGPETPLHFTRYSPAYKFDNPPTRVEALERAYALARKEGVLYVYVGNVDGHKYESTYCPSCGERLIRRSAHQIVRYDITDDKKCPKCATPVPITGKYMPNPA